MSYKYNSLAGRLISGANSVGYGLKRAGDATKIIYSPGVKFPKVKSFGIPLKPGCGPMSTELIEKYKKFQTDDGVPVHLKGGQSDQAMYYLTLLLCVVGVEESLRFIYRASFPQVAQTSEQEE